MHSDVERVPIDALRDAAQVIYETLRDTQDRSAGDTAPGGRIPEK